MNDKINLVQLSSFLYLENDTIRETKKQNNNRYSRIERYHLVEYLFNIIAIKYNLSCSRLLIYYCRRLCIFFLLITSTTFRLSQINDN